MSKRVNPSINAISTLVVVIITIALLAINILPVLAAKRQEKGKSAKVVFAIPAAAVAVLVICLAAIKGGMKNSHLPYEGQTLRVYNCGEYTGENLIPNFEEMTGAKVIMDLFDSNEQMYIKIANGESYDVVIPSDYMIQRLISEELLQPLNKDNLNCYDLLVNDVLDLSYDPGNVYSVPYFWGTVGIVYDTTKVSEEELAEKGFNIFLDEKYKGDIYLYDSERDSFMMALKALGYSMNTESEEELNAAYDWLVQCVETMDPEIVTDEIIDNMAQGRKAMGIVYSGDAAYIMSENENMGFYMPETGTNFWVDGMVIPANANNVELAHEFMDYVSSYEGAYDNSSYVGYTSPNKEVMDELSGEGGDYEGINAYLPRTDNEMDEVFEFNAQTRKIISNLWSKVKIAASNVNN